MFAPGLGQAVDGETSKALIFGGLGVTGITIYGHGVDAQKEYLKGTDPDYNLYLDNELKKKVGASMYLNAGLLSAYDTFQSRVGVYQAAGKFQFLPKTQNVSEFLIAPFHFSYLKRPTTWIPFALAMALGYDHYMSDPRPHRFHTRGSDVAAGVYLSYNAGTGEEAYFRGVLYPTLYESWNGHWTANVAQSLIFGYMHGPQPYPQIIAGWYFGYLAEKNGFELGENIFIHAWWDVWILTANLIKNRSNSNNFYVQLPQIDIRF